MGGEKRKDIRKRDCLILFVNVYYSFYIYFDMAQVSRGTGSWLCMLPGGHLVRQDGKKDTVALLRGQGRSSPSAPTSIAPQPDRTHLVVVQLVEGHLWSGPAIKGLMFSCSKP